MSQIDTLPNIIRCLNTHLFVGAGEKPETVEIKVSTRMMQIIKESLQQDTITFNLTDTHIEEGTAPLNFVGGNRKMVISCNDIGNGE